MKNKIILFGVDFTNIFSFINEVSLVAKIIEKVVENEKNISVYDDKNEKVSFENPTEN